MNDITIIIKTFQRKRALVRLLKSIEKYYPQLPIIVLDDSKKPYSKLILKKFENLDINYIVQEFDIGLSKGRNILINNVNTKYFLLCDDDFEFDKRTNLEKPLNIVKKEKIDILGGNVYNRISLDSLYSILWVLKDLKRLKKVLNKEEFCSIYNGKFEIENNKINLSVDSNIENYNKDEIYSTDICSNFFIGNTQKIKNIGGWTPETLKVGEHEFFFLKTKKENFKVCYTPIYGVRHYPKKSFKYMKFRLKAEKYFKNACEAENIEKFEVVNKAKKQIIYSYNKK